MDPLAFEWCRNSEDFEQGKRLEASARGSRLLVVKNLYKIAM